MRDANRVVLDAVLVERGDLRYTPVGIAAVECALHHASTQREGDRERRVECDLAGIAFGEQAQSIARLPKGTALRCKGFLARRYRTGITLALHIDEFELLNRKENDDAASNR